MRCFLWRGIVGKDEGFDAVVKCKRKDPLTAVCSSTPGVPKFVPTRNHSPAGIALRAHALHTSWAVAALRRTVWKGLLRSTVFNVVVSAFRVASMRHALELNPSRQPVAAQPVAAQRGAASCATTAELAESARHENRRSPRLAVNHPAELEFRIEGRPQIEGVILKSLAEGGLRLALPAPVAFPEGSPVTVSFKVAKERFYLHAVVAWIQGCRVGAQFDFARGRELTRQRWVSWIGQLVGDSAQPIEMK